MGVSSLIFLFQKHIHMANGWIDDLRIYDRALSDAEIEQIAAGNG